MGHPRRVFVVGHGHRRQPVRAHEDVAHVLRLLDGLARARGRALHEDLGGEGDEVLGGAALEETDTREVEAGLLKETVRKVVDIKSVYSC